MYINVFKETKILAHSACFDTYELAQGAISGQEPRPVETIEIVHITEETGKRGMLLDGG